MKTLSDIEPVLSKMGASVRDASNWIARLDDLRDRLPATIAGSARKLSRDHARDLCLIAAMVKAGAAPAMASIFSASLLRSLKATGKVQRNWLVFPAGKLDEVIGTNAPDIAALSRQFGEVPLSLVPVGAVVRMVDDLFEDKNDQCRPAA